MAVVASRRSAVAAPCEAQARRSQPDCRYDGDLPIHARCALVGAGLSVGIRQDVFAADLDRRDPIRIRHAVFEMVMVRVSAIACGHKDSIDLDRLRHDPLMKLAVAAAR
jgi:hypothetical protein